MYGHLVKKSMFRLKKCCNYKVIGQNAPAVSNLRFIPSKYPLCVRPCSHAYSMSTVSGCRQPQNDSIVGLFHFKCPTVWNETKRINAAIEKYSKIWQGVGTQSANGLLVESPKTLKRN